MAHTGHKISDRNYRLILAIAVLESNADIFTEEDTQGERGLGTGLCKRQGLGAKVSRLWSFPAQPFLHAVLQESYRSPDSSLGLLLDLGDKCTVSIE